MTSCSSLWEVHQDDGMRAQRLGAAWQLSGGEEFQSRAPRRARDSVPYRPRTATLTNANLDPTALGARGVRGDTGETGDYDAKVELRRGGKLRRPSSQIKSVVDWQQLCLRACSLGEAGATTAAGDQGAWIKRRGIVASFSRL